MTATPPESGITEQVITHFRAQRVLRRDLLQELEQRDASVLVALIESRRTPAATLKTPERRAS